MLWGDELPGRRWRWQGRRQSGIELSVKTSLITCAVLVLFVSGCFRTTYRNLEPTPATPAATSYVPRDEFGWRHFFVFGWFPGERVIDATGRCGAPERVKEIRTGQTFPQVLIAAALGLALYVSIYSPYTGRVVCVGEIER